MLISHDILHDIVLRSLWNNPSLNSDIHIHTALETAAKSVWQFHDRTGEFQPAFDYFRRAANEAIKIGDEKNLTSRKELHGNLYHGIMNSAATE